MSSFIVYPAIDIRDGKCVRLQQGDYNQETIYNDSPLKVAKSWEEQGGKFIHLVDLDGAKAGHPVNDAIIGAIAANANVPVQVGGGLRNLADVEKLLGLGVSRVIIGTAAINDHAFTEEVLAKYGDKVAIGIDARNGYVATHGWLNTSEVRAEALAKELAAKGAETFIYTDISRDGMMQGPNVDGILSMAQASGKTVIASGGVTSLDDLLRLNVHSGSGVGGAIVGKALYTGNIDLSGALRALGQK
ncbi:MULTISPECIES: 1-(5-phosphoribosyl)-5-[(5-phosphoribosylamino)methylideneamino]imidazole-4-carboxamide isomerase [Paenibacillus]|jgi:phosphoribosylformimino-5-aminoimidazole carboxamide ribotide isomerase|uniref:1-(5-phosphoribosyl)-5-[(5-phosphoribosylamino)methylideneamino] imidazole-4-carboxamide isomerase n=1 Tax=Paenibacillus odorifer TaxID=189426 RepID=A0ABX3GCF9_9BACL|nr:MULTISPECIES: 1-(5-phosphoribosyl)-5-[(5-phosphoribosylamino)methylideneamino]imidazole-4-carboxamide isomerase [Paenibacillus]MDH6429610.1 phosphoribosylformimino-5-aminoimidazole carboxamide ribotide isomerase [Paenibacillus sp. PastH-4]MDH6445819.1 phosphoribosylformimino-5-aminoimidazole carboxamide ribotide isomerase [Paenibacillus sp. PastF-4]MDH6529705.1 phosphoribosylformimino-5-aminoimidazole carboxamide ribotide isomerase [Paenibacillus sp. PastH-3]OMC63292.1 1-(5-phosphoribosyl)-5